MATPSTFQSRLRAYENVQPATGQVCQRTPALQGGSTAARPKHGAHWLTVTRSRRWRILVLGVYSGVFLLLLALIGAVLLLTPTASPTPPERMMPSPVVLPLPSSRVGEPDYNLVLRREKRKDRVVSAIMHADTREHSTTAIAGRMTDPAGQWPSGKGAVVW
jgi:hypothetical protein